MYLPVAQVCTTTTTEKIFDSLAPSRTAPSRIGLGHRKDPKGRGVPDIGQSVENCRRGGAVPTAPAEGGPAERLHASAPALAKRPYARRLSGRVEQITRPDYDRRRASPRRRNQ